MIEVFTNRRTPLKYPIAFTKAFYNTKETQQRWNNFLSSMGKQQLQFIDVVHQLSKWTDKLFEK